MLILVLILYHGSYLISEMSKVLIYLVGAGMHMNVIAFLIK